MPPKANPEQFIDVSFPEQGIDTSSEFRLQKPLTTPYAANVRHKEPLGMMRRGGRRKGLLRYIDDQLEGGELIQHLNVVVDPQAPALSAASDLWDVTNGEPDTSTNNLRVRNPAGRYRRPGGSGVRPNRNIPSGGGGGGELAAMQQASNGVAAGSGTTTEISCTATFPGNTAADNWIVVGIQYGNNQTPAITSVTDTLGTVYTEIQVVGGGPLNAFLAVYYGKATASGANAVTATVGFSGAPGPGIRMIAGEYQGVAAAAPLLNDTGLTETYTNSSGRTATGGEVDPIETATSLYVGFFLIPAVASLATYAAGDGFRIRKTHTGFPPGAGTSLHLVDDIDPTNPLPGLSVEPTIAWTASPVISAADYVISIELQGA